MTQDFTTPFFRGLPWAEYRARKERFVVSPTRLGDSDFSYETALFMAECSKLAYEDSSTIENVVRNDWGFSGFDFMSSGATQGYIISNDNLCLITFRGTETGDGDWWDNLNLFTVDRPYGYVHLGFYDAYQRIQDSLVQGLGMLAPAGKPVWITGHSLGGAITTIAAAELKDEFSIGGAYTFGQPRVGFQKLERFISQNYKGRYHRFVNRQDPVTGLLPNWFLRPWKHVERLIHLVDDMEGARIVEGSRAALEEPAPLTSAEFLEMRNGLKRLRAFRQERGILGDRIVSGKQLDELRLNGRVRSISDHYIDNYIDAIRPLAEGATGT